MKPTDELYKSLMTAYSHFNKVLFDGELPDVIFTVQRQKGVLGYFAPERWSSVDGKHCHEIAINPTHLGQSRIVDVLQTLVHEMVHCWQHCFGTPGRGSYHNKEWAYKMKGMGLQPTSTGLPGGNIVGPQMSDYPIEGGQFLSACETLLSKGSFSIPWIDRHVTPKSLMHENSAVSAVEVLNSYEEKDSKLTPTEGKKGEGSSLLEVMQSTYSELLPENTFVPVAQSVRAKNKYQCPGCRNRVWGKPNMRIICGDCNTRFEALS